MPKANVTWTNNMQFVAGSGSGHAVVLDTSTEAGGQNSGPTPMELILMGLGGCSGMDVVFILQQKMKKDLLALQVAVEGTKAEEHPRRYTDITVNYKLRGREIAEKDVARAIALSLDKYCSVANTIKNTAKITAHYEYLDEASGQTFSADVALEPSAMTKA